MVEILDYWVWKFLTAFTFFFAYKNNVPLFAASLLLAIPKARLEHRRSNGWKLANVFFQGLEKDSPRNTSRDEAVHGKSR